jgi:hypothetical protein
MSIKNFAIANNALTDVFYQFFGNVVDQVYLAVTADDDYDLTQFRAINADLEEEFKDFRQGIVGLNFEHTCIVVFTSGKIVEWQFDTESGVMLMSKMGLDELTIIK